MTAVSIIMNCYNGEAWLREAIDSVFAQTFTDWELIFWDNASTDGSAAIARSYGPRLRNFRCETNVPLGAARHLAMAEASGEWIGFLDTDDIWYPHKLERQMAALAGSAHVLCYGGIANVAPSGKLIREVLPSYPSGDQFEAQLNQFEINMVTPLVRRDVLARNGLCFEPSLTASEEYNLFMRVMTKGTVASVPEVLGAWRIQPGSLTDRQIDRLPVERRFTLAQLERENPGITAAHSRAFREAQARGDYYEGRYLMGLGRRLDAFRLLGRNAWVDRRYAALAVAALVPGAWRAIHSNTLKLKVLPRLFGIARYR